MEREMMFIAECIEKYSGITIGEDKFYIIENRVPEILKLHQLKNVQQLCRLLTEEKNGVILDELTNAISINETFWFRDKTQYAVFENILLPEYIKQLRGGSLDKVKIWSCACSTGQEPYSIAMAVDQYLIKNNIRDIRKEQFEVIATDICDDVLSKGSAAEYDDITMERGLDPLYTNLYFEKKNHKWKLKDEIRCIVQFKKINLKKHLMKPLEFDIIFCKNVLIYFSEKGRKDILKGILTALKQDGIIFFGASEIIDSDGHNLKVNEHMTHENKHGRYYTLKNKIKITGGMHNG